jgi:hypothetical protein
MTSSLTFATIRPQPQRANDASHRAVASDFRVIIEGLPRTSNRRIILRGAASSATTRRKLAGVPDHRRFSANPHESVRDGWALSGAIALRALSRRRDVDAEGSSACSEEQQHARSTGRALTLPGASAAAASMCGGRPQVFVSRRINEPRRR